MSGDCLIFAYVFQVSKMNTPSSMAIQTCREEDNSPRDLHLECSYLSTWYEKSRRAQAENTDCVHVEQTRATVVKDALCPIEILSMGPPSGRNVRLPVRQAVQPKPFVWMPQLPQYSCCY